jgi:hypothetical protein
MPRSFCNSARHFVVATFLVAIRPRALWPDLLRLDHPMPHGSSLWWKPIGFWLHLIADSLIGLSYLGFAISAMLAFVLTQGRCEVRRQCREYPTIFKSVIPL